MITFKKTLFLGLIAFSVNIHAMQNMTVPSLIDLSAAKVANHLSQHPEQYVPTLNLMPREVAFNVIEKLNLATLQPLVQGDISLLQQLVSFKGEDVPYSIAFVKKLSSEPEHCQSLSDQLQKIYEDENNLLDAQIKNTIAEALFAKVRGQLVGLTKPTFSDINTEQALDVHCADWCIHDGTTYLCTGNLDNLIIYENIAHSFKVLAENSNSFNRCAWSPDGKYIAATINTYIDFENDPHDAIFSLKLYSFDFQTKQLQFLSEYTDKERLCSSEYPIYNLAWSPDGKYLALVDDKELKILSVVNNQCVLVKAIPNKLFDGYKDKCSLHWISNEIVAINNDNQIIFHSLSQEHIIHPLHAAATIDSFSVSPDGRKLVMKLAGMTDTQKLDVYTFDATENEYRYSNTITIMDAAEDMIETNITWSRTGKYIALAHKSSVYILSTNGIPLVRLPIKNIFETAYLLWAPDDSWLVLAHGINEDSMAQLWCTDYIDKFSYEDLKILYAMNKSASTGQGQVQITMPTSLATKISKISNGLKLASMELCE